MSTEIQSITSIHGEDEHKSVDDEMNTMQQPLNPILSVTPPDWNRVLSHMGKVLQTEQTEYEHRLNDFYQQRIDVLQSEFDSKEQGYLSQLEEHSNSITKLKHSLTHSERSRERIATVLGYERRKRELWYDGTYAISKIYNHWKGLTVNASQDNAKQLAAGRMRRRILLRRFFNEWSQNVRRNVWNSREEQWNAKLQATTSRADHEAAVRVSEMQQRLLQAEVARDKAIEMVRQMRIQMHSLLMRGLSAMDAEAGQLAQSWGVDPSLVSIDESDEAAFARRSAIADAALKKFSDARLGTTMPDSARVSADVLASQTHRIRQQQPHTSSDMNMIGIPNQLTANDVDSQINHSNMSDVRSSGGFEISQWDQESQTQGDLQNEHNMTFEAGGLPSRISVSDNESGLTNKVLLKRNDQISTPHGKPPTRVTQEESVVLRSPTGIHSQRHTTLAAGQSRVIDHRTTTPDRRKVVRRSTATSNRPITKGSSVHQSATRRSTRPPVSKTKKSTKSPMRPLMHPDAPLSQMKSQVSVDRYKSNADCIQSSPAVTTQSKRFPQVKVVRATGLDTSISSSVYSSGPEPFWPPPQPSSIVNMSTVSHASNRITDGNTGAQSYSASLYAS